MKSPTVRKERPVTPEYYDYSPMTPIPYIHTELTHESIQQVNSLSETNSNDKRSTCKSWLWDRRWLLFLILWNRCDFHSDSEISHGKGCCKIEQPHDVVPLLIAYTVIP